MLVRLELSPFVFRVAAVQYFCVLANLAGVRRLCPLISFNFWTFWDGMGAHICDSYEDDGDDC